MDIKGMLSGVSDSIQKKLIGKDVDKILKQYPDAKKDLVQHYVMSRMIGRYTGPVNSLGIGLFKEAIDGVGALIGSGPTKGREAGFSVDDLGADWAGAMYMSPDKAYKKGLFKHTETKDNITGLGQGKPVEVVKKIIS